MTKPYYELHITLIGDKEKIQKAVEACGWSFSAIDKDIILGEGVKCYATRHFNARLSLSVIEYHLTATALALSACDGMRVIRKEIEHVIYDERIN